MGEFLKIYDSTTPVFQVSGNTVASGSTDLLGIFVPSAGYPDVTGSMNITGNLGVSGTVITPNVTATTITAGSDIIIGNGRYIGSTSDTDAIQIESDGDVYYKGSRIGEARGVKREWVAGFFFFFFMDII